MAGEAARLDNAIKAVCPIIGVAIGRIDNRSTWRIDFAPEATDAQRKAAAVVMAAFDPRKATPAPKTDAERIIDALVVAGIVAQDRKAAVLAALAQ